MAVALDRWTFIAWFYTLVFIEKLLRWILKHFVGHHKDTRRPYSLVNAMDPCFDGFCPFPPPPTAVEPSRPTAAAQQETTTVEYPPAHPVVLLIQSGSDLM